MDTPRLLQTAGPADIERQSFAIIDSLVPEPRPFEGAQWEVARRLVHTSADFELLSLLRFSPGAVRAGVAALRSGATVVTDTRMCQVGIPGRRLDSLGSRSVCYMDDPDLAVRAREQGVTRARLAVDEAARLSGPVVFAVGNAPTALLRLMELMDVGRIAPELVVGMPVGFVNAAESKALLMERSDAPWIAIEGRKGGSALAAACVNALAEMALRAG
ncbi:Cobalt-precorrin-8 methylmutase [Fundidesulfovibrio magnetotacticus]|uniref:Cobalt-precorrin-8 methylmutase n=1 Tax=Fundidesulfovibrio magnetotacticus TaxID=2730080 RepID=A0A6V8LUS3_9BACT|nr:precorrin-8X methylmutase [Fundidesulfovibrio magnetotacticus]GFK93407.1 Cobalt-precorrin-8 methylmutase [Fundidesulfovibrio magnetotacticus]